MHRLSASFMGGLFLSVSGSLIMLPAQAHKTDISGDVAGTWHLEPDHSARAGEPARVWVALTQQGGSVIPLDQCDCQLAVYKANQPDAPPLMQPQLQAMSPESFADIPGAEITFPEVGEYQVVLTGSPKAGAAFTPFEMSYTTVVAAGSAPVTPPVAQPENSFSEGEQREVAQTPVGSDRPVPTPQTQLRLWAIGIVIGSLGLAVIVALFLRQQKRSPHKDDSLKP